MLKLKLPYSSLFVLLFTVMCLVLWASKVSGQTRTYLTGQKTGNRVQSGALIGLGPGTAKLSTPMQTEAWGCALGIQTGEFRFYYAPASVLNQTPTEYTTLTAARSFGLAGLLGTGADVYVQFRNTSNATITANTHTYFKLKERPTNVGISVDVSGLLGLTELNSVSGTAYSNASNYSLNTATLGFLSCPNPYNGLTNEGNPVGNSVTKVLIDASGEWYARVTPDANYNSVRLNVAFPPSLTLANVSAEINVNVYNAFTITGDACNVLPIFTSPGEATGITIDAGALVGGLELSQLVANPQYAINGVASQYSSFSSGVASIGVASTVSQSFYYDHVATADDGLHLKLGLSNSLIGLSLAQLNGITFYAYSGTSETPVYTKGLGELATLLGLDLLNLINLGSSHKEIDLNFKPGVSFDRFKIEFNKGLLGVGVIGDALRIYDVSLTPLAPTITVQPNVSGSIDVCEGSDANFSVTATVPAGGTITGYQWQYFDGSNWVNATSGTANTLNVSSVTSAMNNRLYRVIVSGGNASCPQQVISNNVLLAVNTLPAPPPVDGVAICSGTNTTLSVTSPDANYTYRWFTGSSGGTSIHTGTSFTTPLLTSATTYYVESQNTATGCISASRTAVTVTIKALPTVSAIVGTTALCVGAGQTFTNASSDPGDWSSDNPTIATVDEFGFVRGISVGSTSIKYTITNAVSGCSNTATITVNVFALPTITLNSISPICEGTTSAELSYSAVSAGSLEYSILWNDGSFTNVPFTSLPASPITLNVPASISSSDYSGTFIIKNITSGCTSSMLITLKINPKPPAPLVSVQ